MQQDAPHKDKTWVHFQSIKIRTWLLGTPVLSAGSYKAHNDSDQFKTAVTFV
jgi:hypothetical protein